MFVLLNFFLLKMFLCFGKYFDLWDLSEMMMVGGGSKVLVTSYQVSRNDLFLIDWVCVVLLHSYGDVIIAGKRLQNIDFARRLWPVSRKRSLSSHTGCDTGPRSFLSHPFSRFIQEAKEIEDLSCILIPTESYFISTSGHKDFIWQLMEWRYSDNKL